MNILNKGENTQILPCPTGFAYAALINLIERDENDCSAVILKEWLVSELEEVFGKARLAQMAFGGDFPAELQWVVNELKRLKGEAK